MLSIYDEVIEIVETLSRAYNSSVVTYEYTMFELIHFLAFNDNVNIDNDMEVKEINE